MSWLPLDKSTLIKNLIALPPGSLAPCFLSLIKQANLQWLNVVLAFFPQIIYSTRTQNLSSLLNRKNQLILHSMPSAIFRKNAIIFDHFPSGFTSGRRARRAISLKAVFYGAAPSCPYKNLKDQEKCSA